MITEFALTVMYGQITVVGEAPRVLDWTDAHVAQGFSWAPGHVAFGVPDHDGEVLLQVETASEPAVAPVALWAIQVPFEVPPTSSVEIGTILIERTVPVPAGRYALVFQALPGATPVLDYAFVMRLSFVRSDDPSFAILEKGAELKTDEVLVGGPAR